MRRASSVDDYIDHAGQWQEEFVRLREILCSTPLTEEVKWGGPCYTWNGKNIVGIGAFKSYFGLWFHQGALLKDDKKVLINAQVSDELTKAMQKCKGATAAFRELTPGRRREYAEYIASAKRDATKQSRIAKVLPMIADGIGLNDRYRR